MSSERYIEIYGNGRKIDINTSNIDNMSQLFEDLFDENVDMDQYLILSPNPRNIDDSILRDIKRESITSYHIIKKEDYRNIQIIMETCHTSLKSSSLGLKPQGVLFLNRIHEIHELIFAASGEEATEESNYSVFEIFELMDSDNEIEIARSILNWFNDSFFTVLDTPVCSYCGRRAEFIGKQKPSQSEQEKNAYMIDRYECTECQRITRIFRYKSINHLISMRMGLMDESAMLFCWLLQMVGIASRMVLNLSTNNVWVEFYSKTEKRYVHVDPAERIFDCPLVYQGVWGYPIGWVIAIGKGECVDVTKRYTVNQDLVELERSTVFQDIKDFVGPMIDFRNKMWMEYLESDEMKKVRKRNELDEKKNGSIDKNMNEPYFIRYNAE